MSIAAASSQLGGPGFLTILTCRQQTLGSETRRLRDMVESLLDFKSMESGRHWLQFDSIDASRLSADVADEFRKDASLGRRRLQF